MSKYVFALEQNPALYFKRFGSFARPHSFFMTADREIAMVSDTYEDAIFTYRVLERAYPEWGFLMLPLEWGNRG